MIDTESVCYLAITMTALTLAELEASSCFFVTDFLRSTARGSRFNKPAAFNAGRNSGFTSSNARAIPSFAASAWPFTPPPVALIFTSNLSAASMFLKELPPGFADKPVENIFIIFVVYSDLAISFGKENSCYSFFTTANCIFLFFHYFNLISTYGIR